MECRLNLRGGVAPAASQTAAAASLGGWSGPMASLSLRTLAARDVPAAAAVAAVAAAGSSKRKSTSRLIRKVGSEADGGPMGGGASEPPALAAAELPRSQGSAAGADGGAAVEGGDVSSPMLPKPNAAPERPPGTKAAVIDPAATGLGGAGGRGVLGGSSAAAADAAALPALPALLGCAASRFASRALPAPRPRFAWTTCTPESIRTSTISPYRPSRVSTRALGGAATRTSTDDRCR
mmetsp:Transcript_10294/g.23842  ORF Transcript_10294/g.23842 Transcript_10294/m.23842 type:complete len:237 (+) Transcript_10294:740-1450(+)